MAAILEGGINNKDGTSGNPFMSINLLNVDPVTKEGEVAVYTRNTFMGYIKVNLYFNIPEAYPGNARHTGRR